MSKTKPGDSFIIEIDRVYKDGTGKTLYGVKGFNSLVFDDVGIGKLKSTEKKSKKQEVCVGDIMQHKKNGARYIVTGFDDNEDRFACVLLGTNGNGFIINIDCIFNVFQRVNSKPEMTKLFLSYIDDRK